MRHFSFHKALVVLMALSCCTCSSAQEAATPGRMPVLPGLPLSPETYPIFDDTVVSIDGKEFPLAYRKPVDDGPFPVVLFFHGGTLSAPLSSLRNSLKSATPTRFLSKGYMIVASTRRGLARENGGGQEPEGPKSYSGGMVNDGVAAVKKTKTLPGADPESVVIYGGSVGGSLAIETAAQTTTAAVVVGEPTSSLWMGLERVPEYSSREVFPRLYTKEVRSFVRSVLGRIDCPFLLLGGDPSGFDDADYLYMMREFEELGKRAKFIGYAGYEHGFYFGRGSRPMTGEELDEVIEDAHAFMRPHLRTKPKLL